MVTVKELTETNPVARNVAGDIQDQNQNEGPDQKWSAHIHMAAIYELLKEKRIERKKLAEQTSEILIKASKEKRSMTPAEEAEWDTRHADVDRLAGEIERLQKQQELEQHMGELPTDTRTAGREDVDYNKPPGSPGGPPVTAEHRDDGGKPDQWKTLRKLIRFGPASMTPREQRHFMFPEGEAGSQIREYIENFADGNYDTRALGGTSATGDALIPQGYVYNLNVVTKWYGGIINDGVADYIDTTTGAILPWPNMDDTGVTSTAEITAENSAITVANAQSTTPGDPVYSVVNLNAYMYDSGVVKIPIQLLQDSAFNLEEKLVGGTDINNPRAQTGLLAVRIGRKLNKDCTIGSGINQPMGIVTAAAPGWTAAATTLVTYNELIELEHSVDPSYRGSDAYGVPIAKFMFSDTTLKAIKKLTDSNNRPLFLAGGITNGINVARPDTIDGYPFVINQDMSNMTNGARSILFGDLSKYKIRRVRGFGVQIFRELYMGSLQMGFMGYQRFDGQLLTAGSPVKYLANSAT